MSVVDLTLSFWSKQAQAAKASFGEARGKALNNDLGLDDMVKLWNAFSFGTLDRWLWSSPCASGPQSKFKTHSKGNDTLEVSFSTLPLPPNANPSAALIVIRSKTGTGSGKPRAPLSRPARSRYRQPTSRTGKKGTRSWSSATSRTR